MHPCASVSEEGPSLGNHGSKVPLTVVLSFPGRQKKRKNIIRPGFHSSALQPMTDVVCARTLHRSTMAIARSTELRMGKPPYVMVVVVVRSH